MSYGMTIDEMRLRAAFYRVKCDFVPHDINSDLLVRVFDAIVKEFKRLEDEERGVKREQVKRDIGDQTGWKHGDE